MYTEFELPYPIKKSNSAKHVLLQFAAADKRRRSQADKASAPGGGGRRFDPLLWQPSPYMKRGSAVDTVVSSCTRSRNLLGARSGVTQWFTRLGS